MSILSSRSSLALVLAALCLGGQTADAQVAPVTYWLPNWPIGFGGTVGQSSNTYGDFPSFDGSDAGGGVSYARYNFPNGWFVGGEGSGIGLSMNGLNQYGAFGNIRSLNYQGVQFGYNFQNAPLTVYAGFDTLKYSAGIGAPLASFDTMSGTLPGYSAHAGAEFRPTPNLSLSLGFGYTTLQSGRVDSDINSPLLPGASPFAVGGRR
jgi:opacity protein-like surface antigen